jgi:hypothetical protein
VAWAKSIGVGLVLGALLGVTSPDCFGFPFVPAGVVAFFVLGRSATPPDRLHMGLSALIIALMAIVAWRLPFKFFDTNVTRALSSPCTSLGEVAQAANWQSEGVPASVLNREVCFSGLQPSLREVEKVARENALAVHVASCGNGATLLWGSYPIIIKLKLAPR